MFARLPAVVLAVLVWLLGVLPAAAGGGEAFLRAQLLAGRDVNFNDNKCGLFEPTSIADLAKATDCRIVSGTALADLIKDKKINEVLSPRGIYITGLVVKGDVDLRWVDIRANFICIKCLFEGKIILTEATAEHDLRFEGSELFAGLDASAAQVKGRLSFVDHTTVRGGSVDLTYAKISDALEANAATFDGESLLNVREATISHVLLHASTFEAGVEAYDADINGALIIDGGTKILGSGLLMKGIAIDSFVRIGGNTTISCLDLSSAKIRSNVLFDGDIDIGEKGLDITNTTIDGQLYLSNSTVEGDFKANGVNITRGMISAKMHYKRMLALNRAEIGGDLRIVDSSMSNFMSQRMHVGGSLYFDRDKVEGAGVDMKGVITGADLEFRNTFVKTDLEFNQVAVGKQLDFEADTNVLGSALFVGMTVGGDLLIGYDERQQAPPVLFNRSDFSLAIVSSNVFIHNAVFADTPALVGTEIRGHLDTTSAKLPGLDMTRAVVRGDFRIAASGEPHQSTAWTPKAKLTLKNAHVGVIQDENEGPEGDPWPAKIDLEGFAFDRFGREPAEEWIQDEWFARTSFEPSPYMRLAKYYTDEGKKELSDKTLYAEKSKETIEAWRRCAEPKVSSCAHALGLTLLRVLIGYGIGNGLFQALIWVLVLTFVGMLVLRSTREGGRWQLWGGPSRGPLWCIGASINQLLPIVELNKEFKDYFDDPHRERFASWQLIYFAIHAVMGYVLASFVVAAIAGLTQAH